ncbi:hypothetical protein [Rhodoplanes sp. Z2-YC6860]|uniref:hypothetical protein n=1 Tax=Rhodoplanes sp. Z2-YC6860 TaxID=674703 RepID=UPI0012ED8C84|nr:hypothetical protein [Rhodoplanes sp. Z2-YC6860]
MRRPILTAICVAAFTATANAPAHAQLNVGTFINEMARRAQEAERQRLQIEQQQRAERALALEQKRYEAEVRAQQKLDQDRKEALLAAEQADLDRIAKAAEEARLRAASLERLLPEARQLIADATAFLKTNPPRVIELVEAISNLDAATKGDDPNKVASLIETLKASLRTRAGFDRFAVEREGLRQRELEQSRNQVNKLAGQQREFFNFYFREFSVTPSTQALVPAAAELERALSSSDFRRIEEASNRAAVAIRNAGLVNEFNKSRDVLEHASDDTNAIRRTERNAFLIDGSGEDFVTLVNSSPKAPHVSRALGGGVQFEKGLAKACIYEPGFDKRQTYLLKQLLLDLQARSIDLDAAECTRSDLGNYDVIGIRRSGFARLKSSPALALLSEIEADRFRPLKTVTSEEQLRAREIEERERERNRAAIASDKDDGYGIIISDAKNSNLCLVVDSRLRAHKTWLDGSVDRLSSEVVVSNAIEKTGMDDAYRSIQRQECGSVYSSSKELKKLNEALVRDRLPDVISVPWATSAEIQAIEKRLTDEDARIKQIDYDRRQKAAIEREAEDRKSKEEAAKRENRQNQLRAQFGNLAASTAAAVAKDVRESFDTTDWQSTVGFAQFPWAVAAYHRLTQTRWELQSFDSQVEDFGTAYWGGRPLEAAIARVSFRMRNRILGQYKDVCFILARVNDTEFGMRRDGVSADCTDFREIESWKANHKFESRWVAE